ncbi:MAG: ribonuclease P protein component [Saccharofermentanales bacterium]
MKFTSPLRFNYEFGKVYKKGRYLPGRYLVLHFIRHGRDYSRLGVTTGKKVRGSVQRNRMRRLMRECYRLNEPNIRKGYDIVLLGRDDPQDVKLASVERDFIYLFKKAGIWEDRCPDPVPAVSREGLQAHSGSSGTGDIL